MYQQKFIRIPQSPTVICRAIVEREISSYRKGEFE